MEHSKKQQLFNRAKNSFIGGVGAAGRYVPALGLPLYLSRADGSKLYDIDGNEYIDYHGSSGATFIGYNNRAIKRAIEQVLEVGYFCNYETEQHEALAKKICEVIPSAERVRFANSGTEATLAAVRLARAYTGKEKILKFEGHFHGMHEMTWFNCHTDTPPLKENGEVEVIPDSAGIPKSLHSSVVVIPFNNPDIFLSAIKRHEHELAAVIMEPVMYNSGCILPDRELVELIRRETERRGIVLIFDEVLSGFRMCIGGGQEYLGVTPDLTTLAKALGGSGLPIAALVGKREVMSSLTPEGPVVMSGTYTGHLLEVAGALEALSIMEQQDFYPHINGLADRLYSGINQLFEQYHIKAVVQGLGARFGMYFGLDTLPIYDYRKAVDGYRYDQDAEFTRKAFERGMYFHDFGNKKTPTHHGFTYAHTKEDIEETLNRVEDILKEF